MEKTSDIEGGPRKGRKKRNMLATRETKVAHLRLDEGAVAAVGAVASRLGLCGDGFAEMAQTWLRPIVDEGLGATSRGLNRARCVIKFLGTLISGKNQEAALEDSGLTLAQVVAFRYACPEFGRVYRVAKTLMKEAFGERILDTAFDMATNGYNVYAKDGRVIGKKKSEKMLDRLLVLAGDEFRRDMAVAGTNAPGRPSSVALTFNFGGGKKQNMEVIDV